MKYFLTVIVPHYNDPVRLERLLVSIGEHEDVQVIVVDDNSTENLDRYLQVTKKYASDSTLFISNDTGKKSIGTCRNMALKRSEGKWILFADSDDYMLDGWYDTVSRYFGSSNDVVFFPPASIFDDTGEEADRHKYYVGLLNEYGRTKDKDADADMILSAKWYSPWSKLVKNETVQKNDLRFYDSIIAEDSYFAAMLACCIGSVEISDGKIYCVTRSSGSITTRTDYEIFRVRLEARIAMWVYLREHLTKKQLIKCGYNNCGIEFVFDTYANGYTAHQKEETRRMLKEADIPIITWSSVDPFKVIRGSYIKIKRRFFRDKKYMSK